jgi:hypothetical protein
VKNDASTLLSGRREAELQLRAVADLEPEELALRGALQQDELDVLVVDDRASHELHFPARLAFEVEDLLALPAHVDPRVARVVAFHALALLGRDAKAHALRARLG